MKILIRGAQLRQIFAVQGRASKLAQRVLAAGRGRGETAPPLIEDIRAATPDVIASVRENLPKGFPQRVLHAILKGLSQSARQFEAMPAT